MKTIVGEICSGVEAAKILNNDDLWKNADDHIIASESTPISWNNKIPIAGTKKLKFISGNKIIILDFKTPARLDQQTLSGVRELTADLAAILDKSLGELKPVNYQISEGDSMGYQMRLHLVDVKIKDDYVDIVNRKLSKHKSVRDQTLKYFLDWAVIADDGFLSFRYDENVSNAYGPNEDDGTVPAMDGKWYGDEAIAEWLKQYSESGGRIVFHSLEADGEAFGYEFDGKGRMRELSLQSVGKWT